MLGEDARDDAVDHALEVFCHVGNGLAVAESCGGVIEEDGSAAEARDADLERDARAQRRLLENQGKEAAGEPAAVTVRASLDIRGEMEELARLQGGQFHAGEEVVRDG